MADLNTILSIDGRKELCELVEKTIHSMRPGIDLEASKACIEHFDTWQRAVQHRLDQVITSKDSNDDISVDLKEGKRPVEDKHRVITLLLLLLLSNESYSAESRTLLRRIAVSLQMTPAEFLEIEGQVAGQLQEAAALQHENHTSASSSRWKIGLASVAGAVAVGVTGGLAAPLVAAGLGSVLGGIGLGGTVAASYLGAVAGSSVLVGGLFGGYGARMAGRTMQKYAAQIKDFAFLPLPAQVDRTKHKQLMTTIGISGWLASPEDVVDPWTIIDGSTDGYALRYEVSDLLSLGTALSDLMLNYAFAYVKKEIIKRTVFASLMAALWPLGLLKVGKILDNPWRIAFIRSQKAGTVLADALCEKVQGNRPVTLYGFSLGGRVIYEALLELARRKQFGLIETVVMMGCPCPTTTSDWAAIRSVVSDRVVNVYSTRDYILGFLYRTASIQLGVAGLQPVEVLGVENIDVSDLVEGHLRYRFLVGTILAEKVKVEGIDKHKLSQQQSIYKDYLTQEKAAEESAEKTDEAQERKQDKVLSEVQEKLDRQNQARMNVIPPTD